MSSSRRNGSVSRAAEAASKNRLHMDRNPQHSRITDPSNPAGRRKEIDNVMKRARQASPGSWDRKLLEVEEKDPNRWRHSGYKQLYLEGAGSASPRRSRSPARRERSPARRDRSPLAARRSPRRTPRRTPPRRSGSVRRRSPRVSPRRSPRRSPRASPRRSPRASPRRSSSGSTGSSCSDESCSVCSANNRDKKRPEPPTPAPPPPKGATIPPRNVKPARAVQPTRELLKAREGSKRTREEKVLEWQRGTAALRPVTIPADRVQIKREGAPVDPRRPPAAAAAAGVSPGAIAAALTLARSRSPSDASLSPPPARLTLSERFGKMAQWSAARAAPAPALDNMRITRDTRRRADTLTVRIEPAAPPPGAYPAELAAAAPAGAPCWDDVTVRYEYYKKRGYLRGLTLADYVKWEEWWYKYQEWLERERAYERWAEPEGRRRERRRGRARHRRS